MEPLEIAPGIYDVGVIDWNIRDFHGYSTDLGTTYNSFLIVDEKIALLDTAALSSVLSIFATVSFSPLLVVAVGVTSKEGFRCVRANISTSQLSLPSFPCNADKTERITS